MDDDVNIEWSNPWARLAGNARRLEERLVEELPVESAEEGTFLSTSQIEKAAAAMEAGNDEIHARSLLILLGRLSVRDSADDVMRKLREAFPDFSLADEALEFLLKASSADTREAVRSAQQQFRSIYDREIRAGRNIQVQAQTFSKEGLGTPTTLRELYRDIVLNPREPLKLFDELTKLFSYGKMNSAIRFLLHSLGDDMKSKGPTISRGELSRLLDDTRSLQGLLGVYRFFQSRMRMIRLQLEASNPDERITVTFEDLAKGFVRLLGERYVSPDKLLQLSKQLGISNQLMLQILIFTQMHEGLKQTFGGYYRNAQHREELRQALLKTMEQLEDQMEDEEEKEKEDE
jgi:type III secretion protein W